MRANVLVILVFSVFWYPCSAEKYNTFEENGKVGLKDEGGNVLIPARYDAIGWSDDSFSVLNAVTGYKESGLWGLISINNHHVTPAAFTTLVPTEGNLLIAFKKIASSNKLVAGCLNTSGKDIIPFQYDGLTINSLRAIVYNKSADKFMYGLVDLDNKPLIPITFQHIKPLGSLRYAVQNFQDKVALYSESGKALTPFSFDDITAFKKNYAVFKEGNRYGLLDREGLIKVQAQYEEITLNEDGSAEGRMASEWIVLDGQNTVLQSITVDSVFSLNNNLFGIKKDGQLHLVNAQFGSVTPVPFTYLGKFNHNKAVVGQHNKYGLISSNGRLLIECLYDELIAEKNYVLARVANNQWTLLDSVGTRKTPKTYQGIELFNGIYFTVKSKGYYGAINADGKEIVSCVYDSILQYKNSKLVVKLHGSYGIIDMSENWVVAPQPFPQRLIAPDRYLQKQGNTIFLKSFDGNILYFTDNDLVIDHELLIETVSTGGTWKIDLDGRIVSRQLPPVDAYETIYAESEGLRGIKKDGRYGFVDDLGRLRIANRYEDIKPFQERLAAVKILGKWGFIDHDEKLVIQPVHEETTSFKDGHAIVMQKGLYGLINSAGKVVLPVRYQTVVPTPAKRYLLTNDGLKGLADKDGRLIVIPKYHTVIDLNNGYVIVERDGKYGLLTTQGISTIPLMYDNLIYDEFNARYFALKRGQWKKIL